MLNTRQKLTKLRRLFPKYDIDCYLVPHTDEYQNEFLPKYSRRLEWLSNFTGSAGDIIVIPGIDLIAPTSSTQQCV